MPTRFPPDGVPLYKCVDIWLDNADSMFGAIELAWEKYDSSKLARLYETKPVVLAEIVKVTVTDYHTGVTENDRHEK